MIFAYIFLAYANVRPTACTPDNYGYFWHLTDVHLDLDYDRRPNCRMGTLGDYNCDSPLPLVKSAVSAMADFSADKSVDFIVWSGDNSAHTEMTRDQLEETIRRVSDELHTHFSPARVYVLPAVGNHDVSPANRMSPRSGDPDRTDWCHRLASNPTLWGSWIKPHTGGDQPPGFNFSDGCFYSHLLSVPGTVSSRPLLLVSLNGLVWYRGNPLVDDGLADPVDQLNWLERTFQWARRSSTKVLIVSHFPPGASENHPRQYRFLVDSINRRFLSLLEANADLIMAGLFAHEHVDTFRVLSDSHRGRPAVSLLLGPSVTPLRMHGLGSFNPRIRLYRYRRSDLSLLDYTQYYLDLSAQASGQSSQVHWRLEYSSTEEYHLRDLSPTSLAGLLRSFENDTGGQTDSLWSRYWSHELGRRDHETIPTGLCADFRDFLCRCEHLCAMRNLDITGLDTCLAVCTQRTPIMATVTVSGPAPDRSNIPIIVGVIVAFLVILVGVVIVVNREICRKRGYPARRILGANGPMGGVLFSAIDNNLPISFTNPRDDHDRGDRPVNGALVTGNRLEFGDERRTVFHPDMDNYSVVTVNTLDYNEKAMSQKGNHLDSVYTRSVGGRERLPSLPNGAFLTPVGRVPGKAQRSGSYSLTSPPSMRRHVVPRLAVLSCTRPNRSHHMDERESMQTGGDNSSLTIDDRPSLQRTIPAEDYYADDEEAFTDDEENEQARNEDLVDAKAGQDRLFTTLAQTPQPAASPDKCAAGTAHAKRQFGGWTSSNGSVSSGDDRLSSPDQQLGEGFLLDNDRIPLAKRDKSQDASGSSNFIKRLSKSGFRLPPSFYTPQLVLSRFSKSGDPSSLNNHYEGIGDDNSIAYARNEARRPQVVRHSLSGLKHSQSVTFNADPQEKSPPPGVSSRSSRPASVASPHRSSDTAVIQESDQRQQPTSACCLENGHQGNGPLTSCEPPAVLPVYSDEEAVRKTTGRDTDATVKGMASSSGYDYVRI